MPPRKRRSTATLAGDNKRPRLDRKGWPKTQSECEFYGFRNPVEYDADVDENIPELVRSRPYDGKKHYKARLAEGLPPMHDLEEIYQSITSKALELGFEKVLEHLGGRPLRVATVCSGTESPLLALEMVKAQLKKHFGMTLQFRHLFSAEIVPFKQAYIERNFHPRRVFRDVNELKDRVAKTAYGSLEKVPKNVDLLVAGFSCVDFSGLNNNRKTLDDKGESGGTFWAIVRHAMVYRPRMIILENVSSAPWKTISQELADIDYLGIHVPVDTKAYYLPQTRERGYMLCLDMRRMKVQGLTDQEVIKGWPELVQSFRRPASSPMGMFTLSADNKQLEQIEKDMAAHQAAATTRSNVGWARYQLRHHYYRMDNDLGHKRPVTRSQDNGARQMLDFCWKRFCAVVPERVAETIDCNFLRKLQGDGYDMSYKERCLELSQGIERDIDSRAYGVIGCVTPSGIPYLTTRGGPLCGIEALSLQGLPVSKLILTRESQRDLQDLAGNAMSSTVVCAAMLAGLIIGHAVFEKGKRPSSPRCSTSKAKSITFKEAVPLAPSNPDAPRSDDVSDIGTLLERAAPSARYCICEKQSTVRQDILRCTLCGHTACASCAGNPSHSYTPLQVMRNPPADFVTDLRKIIPNRLAVSGITAESYSSLKNDTSVICPSVIWEDYIAAVIQTVGDELHFSDITRGTAWVVTYVGEHSTLNLVINPASGVEWRLFAKALETEPARSVNREILAKPIARMRVTSNSMFEGTWQVCAPLSSSLDLIFEPAGEQVPTYEAICGLQGEGVPSSKVWSQVVIQGSDEDTSSLEVDFRGTYKLLPECGTASASLHKKEASEGKPAVYLFLDPTKLGEPKYDSFVFALEHARDPSYAPRLTIAEVTHTWRPSRQPKTHQESVRTYHRRWADVKTIYLQPYSSDAPITFQSLEPGHTISIDHTGCRTENITLLSLSAPVDTIGSFGGVGAWEVINPLDSPAELRDLAWLLLRATTSTGYEQWNRIMEMQALSRDGKFSGCTVCTPQKPAMVWSCNKRGLIKACEDPQDAALYERQLKSKPVPFLVFRRVDENDFGNLRITLNVQTLLHQAYNKFLGSSTVDGVSFLWRLVPNAHETRNLAFSKFELGNNDADPPSIQPPNFKLTLRPEQLRSLHWMIKQESDEIEPFVEEEVEEALLPELTWRAEAKVSAPRTIRGGLVADDVGYGKTAIILGLIDAQSRRDNAPRPALTNGFIPSKATLILTPRTIFTQWMLEITKFLGAKYKVLGFSKSTDLDEVTIREIQEADIVLIAWEVFGDQKYYRKMQMFTGMQRVPQPEGRNFVDWFSEAHQALTGQVDTLMNKGPSAFLDSLQARRQKWKNATANFTYTPSKRLRGRHYAEANADQPRDAGIDIEYAALSANEESDTDDERDPATLRSKISELVKLQPLRTFAPPKRKKKGETGEQDVEGDAVNEEANEEAATVESDRDDTEYEDIDAPSGQKSAPSSRDASSNHEVLARRNKKDKTTKQGQNLFWSDREGFGIDRKTKDRDWDTTKNLTIHAFSFERLVIDEFTYVKVEPKPIAALQAHARWVLSGTPPLNNFADVNTIAPLLGIHLGVDDDDVKTHNKLRKLKKKIQSDAEIFQAYRAPRSETWHRNRHEHAQTFLDRFARKNVPKIGEIPLTEHYILVTLLPAETAIYYELHRQLLGLEEQVIRGSRSKIGGERTKQIDEVISSSNSADEALLKRCTTLALSNQWKNEKPEVTTCKSLIETRRGQIADAKEMFTREVKLATWLRGKADKNEPHFPKFNESVKGDGFGDNAVTAEAEAVIQKASLDQTEDDWQFFFLEPKQRTGKAAAGETRESADGGTPTNQKKEDKLPALPVRPEKKDDIDAVLRRTVANMRSYLAEWVMRIRALRFLEAMHRVQAKLELNCDKCDQRDLSPSKIIILDSCGHSICSTCAVQFKTSEECVLSTCDGVAKKENFVDASELGGNEKDVSARYGGSKMDKLIEVIENIPEGEKALLFIQFEELMKAASKALTLAQIEHTAIFADDKASTKQLERYLTEGFRDNRVLMLMLGNEMAAGLNLQEANHIVFLSPMLAETQYDYESTMIQAAGRARRYGQTKHVHVYHILAKRTVDVSVFKYRRGSVLRQG
ncbi:putative SNF2 family helicase [Aspergillus affinis]|uniref:putative SNF2 family helicase n=1 Tax=Aspergillus affinis TaxID=1070780 RepID=UPI0022FEDFEA|nr:uncharacterized protein KD926_010574 [Aspergillus affinis]KAI9038630.1 hypothetical protein KD926_010574 [Aspergillus affinis]